MARNTYKLRNPNHFQREWDTSIKMPTKKDHQVSQFENVMANMPNILKLNVSQPVPLSGCTYEVGLSL